MVCFSVVTVTSLCQSQEEMSDVSGPSDFGGEVACKLISQVGPRKATGVQSASFVPLHGWRGGVKALDT